MSHLFPASLFYSYQPFSLSKQFLNLFFILLLAWLPCMYPSKNLFCFVVLSGWGTMVVGLRLGGGSCSTIAQATTSILSVVGFGSPLPNR
ncbi:hypothetical protein QVD17_25305 [Tagetes erecta]|uniref:Uncharacterized protein n=1 Tax=Tagetes erecta TaxID=13708 RepID=A0AAD8KFX6_TARER|nr:hypothetical protein QVD17_25305 [Tagetes erecta]